MIAEIISIGDELLAGTTLNSNATFIAQKLFEIGIEIQRVITIGDKRDVIKQAISESMKRADFVIITGGLGPTHDDVTKTAICDYFNSRLILDSATLDKIKARFKRRGVEMVKINEEQALVPHNAEILSNQIGTAPGLLLKKEGKLLFVLPGVPYEMQLMINDQVVPRLVEKNAGQVLRTRTIRTTGVPESTLFEKLGDIANLEKYVQVAFLPQFPGVNIKLTARCKNEKICLKNLRLAENIIREKIGTAIYGYDDSPIEEIVGRILIEQKKTIAVAESCTGGLITHKLTNISGSSQYLKAGLVTYHNAAKKELLSIPDAILEKHGAVSEETARLMAQNVRELNHVDFGLSTTGIAGPTGGSDEKPVGLVFVGCSNGKQTIIEKHIFKTDRINNKTMFANAAINLLRRALLGLA